MAKILGLGVTHYPPLCSPDEHMSGILRRTLADPGIPDRIKDPANWSNAMREEWSDDFGLKAAARHRQSLIAELRKVRAVLDDFNPDVVLVWGDDQYENFREDIIPPFAICAYDDIHLYPWKHAQESAMTEAGKPNAWNEGPEKHYLVRGDRRFAKELTSGLLDRSFDVSYAYKPLHHHSFAHAFTNTILYLDYDRKGWDYPTVAFPINCYGRKVISAKGFITGVNDQLDLDPPSPTPRRCLDLGAATARALRETDKRVAIIASSSWSHAFMSDSTWRVRPNTDRDSTLYASLQSGDYAAWRNSTLAEFEDAGQQEMLNWCPLLGAMEELNAPLRYSSFVETHIFNSNKVFAVFEPV
ncbi:hypothetical protein [Variovorax paradoxus]|uniref:DODA-type extradiol aromatic ring-opening family dioxygenase n=1 Tax=Variovorax paradoxus TaxID=34073 RepID=UPI003ED13F61